MSHLPEFLDPKRAAEQGRRFTGSYRLGELPRVLDLITNPEDSVRVELEFFRDGGNRTCVRGRVLAEVRVPCQRCLEDITIAVHAEPLLALVQGDAEAERLPEEYDPLLVGPEGMEPRDLVEDEILLALPQVPMHDRADCDPQVLARLADGAAQQNPAGPFAALTRLKDPVH